MNHPVSPWTDSLGHMEIRRFVSYVLHPQVYIFAYFCGFLLVLEHHTATARELGLTSAYVENPSWVGGL